MSGDLLERFLTLPEKAPDAGATLDEQAGLRTVVPPPTGLDAGCEVTGYLGDVTAAAGAQLGGRDQVLHAAILTQLHLLRAYWGERFQVGWDGEWRCASRDSTGRRNRASSSEELNRLMAAHDRLISVRDGCK